MFQRRTLRTILSTASCSVSSSCAFELGTAQHFIAQVVVSVTLLTYEECLMHDWNVVLHIGKCAHGKLSAAPVHPSSSSYNPDKHRQPAATNTTQYDA